MGKLSPEVSSAIKSARRKIQKTSDDKRPAANLMPAINKIGSELNRREKRTTSDGYMPRKLKVKEEGNEMSFSKTKKRGIVAMKANDQKQKVNQRTAQ